LPCSTREVESDRCGTKVRKAAGPAGLHVLSGAQAVAGREHTATRRIIVLFKIWCWRHESRPKLYTAELKCFKFLFINE
jgi:hypothetical protein